MKKKLAKILVRLNKRIISKLTTTENTKMLLKTISKSSYISETENLVKKFSEISLLDFWREYVTGNDAPHYRVPYRGFNMTKLPCDMFIYPDIIYRSKPELIVEIGTQRGGSALFFSDLLTPWGGKVVTVDVNLPKKETLLQFEEKNIIFIKGDINNPETIYNVLEQCNEKNCLVIDDGSHNENDIYNAFRSLNHLVPVEGFYIIEDGMTNAILLPNKKNLQPNRAIAWVLQNYPNFELFREYDRYIFSTVLMGILQRRK